MADQQENTGPVKRAWMVEIDLPSPMTNEFASLIPEQRMTVGTLMSAGTILTYTLTADRRKLWTVVLAETEKEVHSVLARFPIITWTQYSIKELFFHHFAQSGLTRISMN
jgi:hypothetical protein